MKYTLGIPRPALLLVGFCLSSLAGCAHARMDHWIRNEFTVCCNAFCQETDWDEAVSRSCAKEPKWIGAGTQIAGYSSTVSSGGTLTTSTDVEACRTFECGGQVHPW